ncbi:hypothetical protein [Variovorax sp. LG9.2]|uniref:hypothetical protein n=1 Tax=Variovorax sp. LG9.2 TaxID=3048626 RepID=UPI002B226D0A|nr:hypothetical protein [Variovorax sp. LG9.2]MEB0059727.1 hypothetical protein [Variovorax sp. LG9.2]
MDSVQRARDFVERPVVVIGHRRLEFVVTRPLAGIVSVLLQRKLRMIDLRQTLQMGSGLAFERLQL